MANTRQAQTDYAKNITRQLPTKRGFTLLELVIVMAVIAILAAVIVPTFTGIVERANLESDSQVVNELNATLQSYSEMNGAPTGIRQVKYILERAGFDKSSWATITEGYSIMWYKPDNTIVLATTSFLATNTDAERSIAYPEKYASYDITVFNGQLFGYDSAEVEALAIAQGDKPTSGSDGYAAYTKAKSAWKAAKNNASLDWNGSYYCGTAGAYLCLGFSGDSDVAQFAYIGATAGSTEAASADNAKSRGKLLYQLFDAINTGKVSQSCCIVLQEGLTYDCDEYEWVGLHCLTDGFFGAVDGDDDNTTVEAATIKNVTITSVTTSDNADSYILYGNANTYIVNGFIDAVSGSTIVQNVTFSEVEIDEPATDYNNELLKSYGSKNSLNTVGIIGAAIDNSSSNISVTLSNVTVDKTCSIKSRGYAGGLIGYIGSYTSADTVLKGTVTFANCVFSGVVQSTDTTSADEYGAVGGLVACVNKLQAPSGNGVTTYNYAYTDNAYSIGDGSSQTITVGGLVVDTCTVNGTCKSYTSRIGALVGTVTNAQICLTMKRVDGATASLPTTYSSAKLVVMDSTKYTKALFGYIDTSEEDGASSGSLSTVAFVLPDEASSSTPSTAYKVITTTDIDALTLALSNDVVTAINKRLAAAA